MKLSILLVKLRYMTIMIAPNPILCLNVIPEFFGSMKKSGSSRTMIRPQYTFAMPSLIFGLAATISLPRKSKRLVCRLRSTVSWSPVAEQFCRMKYVGSVRSAVAPAATRLAPAKSPADTAKVFGQSL